ncbi:MAG: SMC family ATPase [Spirosomataceae bacterium]
MIPIKLSLQGIQSYRERQEIDFSRLTAAGLFGVFGKVGSGKSTILEAITFCLFGDTERLNNRENRSYNLMNLRSDRLFIDFEFKTGHSQTRYRFVTEGKRSGKHFDKVTLDRKSYQWMEELGDWSPIAADNPAEKIIGLSYENFKRTVIIPQGRFQEFVELKDAERTRMMKELFQLERFELAEPTKKLIEQNNEALAKIEGELKGLGEVTPEMLAQTCHDLQNTARLLEIEKNSLSKKRDEEKEIEALKKLFDKQLVVTETLQKLTNQAPIFIEKKKRLAQYEVFLMTFKPLLDEAVRLKTRQQAEKKGLATKTNELEALAKQLTDDWVQLENLQPAYNNQPHTLIEIAELRTLAQMIDLTDQRDKLQKRIKDGEEKRTVKKEALEIRQQNLQKSKEQRNELRRNQPDMARLSEIIKWFDTKERLLKERDKLKENANELVEKQKQIATQQESLFTPETLLLLPQDIASKSYDVLFENIESVQNKLLTEADSLNVKLIQLQTQRALQQYAGALTHGQPCPMCGSVHHPEVLTVDNNLDTVIQHVHKSQTQLRNMANATLSTLANKLTGFQKEWELLEIQKNQLKTEKWPQKNIEISNHAQQFVWEDFDSNQREMVEKKWKEASVFQQQLIALEASLEKEEQLIQKEEAEIKSKFDDPLLKLKEEISNRNGAIENAQKQLQQLKIEDVLAINSQELIERAQKMEENLQRIRKSFEDLD